MYKIPYRFPKSSARVDSIYRVITTIQIHIASKHTLTGRDIAIRTNKPTQRRIIISTLQIVQRRMRIVVVTSVAERVRVNDGSFQCSHANSDGCAHVAPCVVDVRSDLCAALVVDRDNISEIIFLEEEAVINICGVLARAVHQSDRRALLVVQIEHHILNTVFRPFLGNNLAAVQNELMRDAVNRFARAYTVRIVGVGRESLYAESKMFFEDPNRK